MKTLQKTPEEIWKEKVRAHNQRRDVPTIFKIHPNRPLIVLTVDAMQDYAKTVSEQRDKEIEELRGCLQELFIAYILDVDSEGEPHSSIGRLIEISTNAKNLLEKHKLNN